MPWTPSGGNNNSPWGQNQRPNPPKDLEDLIKKSQDKFKGALPPGVSGKKFLPLAILAIIAIWALTGFYRVNPGEQGVVLRFGEYVRTSSNGLHYHLPSPVETVDIINVEKQNRVEIGSLAANNRRSNRRSNISLSEATMLTGDENIVKVPFTLLWNIKDPAQYLFNVRNPEGTIKSVAESAIREVIAQRPIQPVLNEGRLEVETETYRIVQETLDRFKTGINVLQVQLQDVTVPDEVVDAFRDVQRAEADRERFINEAETYRNSVVPVARGNAARLIQEAEAYREKVVKEAEGVGKRFLSIYEAYSEAPDVYTQRLYLETLEEILTNRTKVIIDSKNAGAGVVPYLPLPELKKRQNQSSDEQ